ncbi:glutamine amidotransferase [Affinibrenneria salicis]|uniref:Glutamine amidotransferase n=1 Tax=Affinibrenneria salicis TaxID=2590031 RepID=A0A5J5FYC0_9GAMM|nr:glutamine amidotransferase [Affinibrenneria salicis]KAA8998949.1 glutamine amidotransferase [Affinibrenneria salicis]
MKSVIAIRHVHFEDLGTLAPLLQQRGYEIRYVDASLEDLSALDVARPDLMVVLGAPLSAVLDDETYPFLPDELAAVRRRLGNGKPLLGICLGAQMIARALGAEVDSLGVKEIGFSALELTEAGKNSCLSALSDTSVLHWHGDRFAIPAGARRLAGTPVCQNQAFSVGDSVLALQFHLEADTSRIEQWLVGHTCELSQAGIDPREIRRQARQSGAALVTAARQAIGGWLDGCEGRGQHAASRDN